MRICGDWRRSFCSSRGANAGVLLARGHFRAARHSFRDFLVQCIRELVVNLRPRLSGRMHAGVPTRRDCRLSRQICESVNSAVFSRRGRERQWWEKRTRHYRVDRAVKEDPTATKL